MSFDELTPKTPYIKPSYMNASDVFLKEIILAIKGNPNADLNPLLEKNNGYRLALLKGIRIGYINGIIAHDGVDDKPVFQRSSKQDTHVSEAGLKWLEKTSSDSTL